jgi:thiamine kinase-like enzyme
MHSPDSEFAARVERLLHRKIVSWSRIQRGYTPAERWLATGGATAVFVKCGVTPLTARWLRREFRAYDRIEASFIPELIAWEDDAEKPILIIEDLSRGIWPPPWTPENIEHVRGCLDAMHGATPDMPSFAEIHGEVSGWGDIAADPRPFLGLALVSADWLDKALPALLCAEKACRTTGTALTHWDIRSDNICIAPGGVKLIDWPASCLSNPKLDFGFWLPSLAFEGGPSPEQMLPNEPEVAAWICGFFAARAGLPEIPDAPLVRRVQRQQLSTALPWVMRAMQLSPIDPR